MYFLLLFHELSYSFFNFIKDRETRNTTLMYKALMIQSSSSSSSSSPPFLLLFFFLPLPLATDEPLPPSLLEVAADDDTAECVLLAPFLWFLPDVGAGSISGSVICSSIRGFCVLWRNKIKLSRHNREWSIFMIHRCKRRTKKSMTNTKTTYAPDPYVVFDHQSAGLENPKSHRIRA